MSPSKKPLPPAPRANVFVLFFGCLIGCADNPQKALVGERCDEQITCRTGQCVMGVCRLAEETGPDARPRADAEADGLTPSDAGPFSPDAAAHRDPADGGSVFAEVILFADPIVAGCADGTREGNLDYTGFPDLAACAGAWSEPGLWSEQSLLPKCGRLSGNHGGHGIGCSAEDLCAAGWHVCLSLQDIRKHGFASCEQVGLPGTLDFFAIRQKGYDLGSGDGTVCGDAVGAFNNVFGCGWIGLAATNASCEPLQMLALRAYAWPDCTSFPPWDCGSNNKAELANVIKLGDANGGVICCRDEVILPSP